MRTCKDCGEVKELKDFPVSHSCKDGHTHCCKICTNRKNRGYTNAVIEELDKKIMRIQNNEETYFLTIKEKLKLLWIIK